MKTAGIREGDLVKCDVRGHIFFAEVLAKTLTGFETGIPRGAIRVRSIMPNITFTVVAPREVVAHYKKMKGGSA